MSALRTLLEAARLVAYDEATPENIAELRTAVRDAAAQGLYNFDDDEDDDEVEDGPED